MPTFDRLDGVGRVRVYDNGGKSVDRYLVLFEDMESVRADGITLVDRPVPYGPRQALALSDNPSYPQGVSLWGYESPPNTWGVAGQMRWQRIPFDSLPENVREHVIARATEVPL